MIRIAMFSGPRNISTTMMRSFENRPDTAVWDEPFYACYLKSSGAPHPMREETLAAQPNEWRTVAEALAAPREDAGIAFEKHIAFHFTGDAPLDWVKGARIFHLIRDPREMIASYKNKYADVSPVIQSYIVQHKIDHLLRRDCPVVDAADILKNPEGMLRALCAALEIPFREEMLAWAAGPRDTDGVWAPHWYDAVLASTGFKPYRQKQISLSPREEALAEACREDYEVFHKRRLITDL